MYLPNIQFHHSLNMEQQNSNILSCDFMRIAQNKEKLLWLTALQQAVIIYTCEGHHCSYFQFPKEKNMTMKLGFWCAGVSVCYWYGTYPHHECDICKAWTSCYGNNELTSEWRHDYGGKCSQLCLSRICWDWRNSFDLEKIWLMRGQKH